MNVWVLTHLRDTEGTRITCDLLARAGLSVRVVDPSGLRLVLSSGRTQVLHPDGTGLPDMVYTRLGSSAPGLAVDVVRLLESEGVRCVNSAKSLDVCRDKLRSFALMAGAGLAIPETVVVAAGESADDAVQSLGGPPYVVKLRVSSKGTGVTVVESMRSLRSTLDVIGALGERALVQRFVSSAAGADTRVLVLGGRAVLAVRRQAVGDEFRSNVYLGGADTPTVLDAGAAELSERAAQHHGLEVAGVDLLEDTDGYVVAEVNGSPGLAAPRGQAPAQLEQAFQRFVGKLVEDNDR